MANDSRPRSVVPETRRRAPRTQPAPSSRGDERVEHVDRRAQDGAAQVPTRHDALAFAHRACAALADHWLPRM